jgi:hypothetical protein
MAIPLGREGPLGDDAAAAALAQAWDGGIRRDARTRASRCPRRTAGYGTHDAEHHFEAALRDGYPALAELRARGVAGAIGGVSVLAVSVFNSGLLATPRPVAGAHLTTSRRRPAPGGRRHPW